MTHVGPLTGYDLFLISRYGTGEQLSTPPNADRRCMEPNPNEPEEKCLSWSGPDHEGNHSWWYCSSEYGDYGSTLDCELQRGHEGDHMGHWA